MKGKGEIRRMWDGAVALCAGLMIFLAGAPAALAQGCAMCYGAAAAQNQQGIRSLNHAILVLMIPVVLLFLGLFAFLYRRRNAQREEAIAPTHSPRTSSLRESILHLS